MSRLYNLDYLRGLAAFGIMIFHYLAWTCGKFEAETMMGRIGIYGVSIFYVLSGLTLYYVYYDKMKPSWSELCSFFRKRVFRIFPLLWVVTLTSIILSRKIPILFNVFLNLTGLFGFVKWSTFYSTGVWSIGNELVFYTFFPLFVLLAKSRRLLFVLFCILIFIIYLYFALQKLSPEQTLKEQWRDYVNPLNQLFLFLGGFLIGLLFHKVYFRNIVVLGMLFFGLIIFAIVPAQGNEITLVTGTNRLIFTFGCFLICLSFYKLAFRLPGVIHNPLILLGEASYSVYLLHPIVYKIVGIFRTHIFYFSDSVRFGSAVVLTLVGSYFTYKYFETYFIELGRRKLTVFA